MKTLIIAPFSPYPVVFGGAIRLYHLVKMLSTLSDVTILAYRAWSPDGDNVGDLRQFCERIILVDPPGIRGRKKALLQVRSFFSRSTFQYLSHYTERFQHELDVVLQQTAFDYVVTDFSQMGYFRQVHNNAKRLLDLHNIEHELLFRRALVESNPLKRLALWVEAKKFQRDELAICQQHDLVFVPSDREAAQLQQTLPTVPIKSLPNSINAEYFAMRGDVPLENDLVFVGTMHVDANRDGVIFFMEEVFPLIRQRVPDVRFSIVGGGPPPEILAYRQIPNVEVTGIVKDVRPYMARAKAMVVPLRVGGGTRLRVLEALAFGLPTISTRLGSEGIEAIDNEHILLADTAQEFAEKVVTLLAEPTLQRKLRTNGRKLVDEKYTWQAVGQQLAEYLRALSPGQN